MQLLGTRTLEAAFALMNEAIRRAGESGDFNDYIRAFPVIPYVDEVVDLNAEEIDIIKMAKFLIYRYMSKPGESIIQL